MVRVDNYLSTVTTAWITSYSPCYDLCELLSNSLIHPRTGIQIMIIHGMIFVVQILKYQFVFTANIHRHKYTKGISIKLPAFYQIGSATGCSTQNPASHNPFFDVA